MIALVINQFDGNKGIVGGIYNDTSLVDTTSHDVVLVDEIPEFPHKLGKSTLLCVDMDTKKLFFEFKDRPLSEQEKIKTLEEKLAIAEKAIDELIFGGVM